MSDVLKVSPTRVTLLKLKKELKTAEHGHKLLKDKRDGLMQAFMKAVRDVKELRSDVNQELISGFEAYVSASALMAPQVTDNVFIGKEERTHIETSVKSIMSVTIPSFTVPESQDGALPYGYLESFGNLDTGVKKLRRAYPKLIRLAELEGSIERLAREIEKTRRRASALEHVRIPLLKNTIRMIYLRLEEQGRDAVVSTMRVKALITK